MKRALGLSLLLCALGAAPASAGTHILPPFRIEMGGNVYFRMQNRGYGIGGLGPWYHYWPYEAHFQTPALPEYPYWPRPQVLPNGQGAAIPAPPPGAMGGGGGVAPAGYYSGHHYGQ